MRRAFLVVLIAACTPGFAQDANVPAKKTAKPAATTKPKLTDKQKIAMGLLESAEGAAGAMETRSRVVAYTQIATIYKATDQKHAAELIERAYESARTLPTDSSDRNEQQINQDLQRQVIDQFIELSPQRVDALLDQMPLELRESALRSLLPYFWKTNNTDRPQAVLMQMALEGEMPYQLAAEVIEKLGSQRPEQVQELFVASLTSYQNHEHSALSSGFTETIAAAYKHVPDPLIISAIDEVLSQAKEADEKTHIQSIQMSFPRKGGLEFRSAYDLQLFSVLPILQQIDPERANRLLSDRQDVKAFAAKYPEGMAGLRKTGLYSFMVNTGQNSGGHIGPTASEDLEQQRANKIVESSAAHPNDALANAALLSPNFAMQAYMGIARENIKKNKTAAGMALRKAQDLLSQISAADQVHTVSDIIYSFEQLGDKDGAHSAIAAGTKIADVFYKQDTDAADPNQAPEAYWVSTSVWRNLIEAAYELDPSTAVSLIPEVPDDQMRVFAQIAIAKRLLGSSAMTYEMSMSIHKQGGAWTMYTSAPVPIEDEKK